MVKLQYLRCYTLLLGIDISKGMLGLLALLLYRSCLFYNYGIITSMNDNGLAADASRIDIAHIHMHGYSV